MCAWLLNICLGYCVALECAVPAFAASALELTSENIATSALRVAQFTNTTGYCYAAVSKAVRPLDVNLYGAAAYEARDLLLQDQRFLPLPMSSADLLRRGDIIVFDRSPSHPYGHISVYQGNETEASDHVAPIMNPQAYGGATVFRLRNDWSVDDTPVAIAPDFRAMNPYLPVRQEEELPLPIISNNQPSFKDKKTSLSHLGRSYGKRAVTRVANTLLHKCMDLLFD